VCMSQDRSPESSHNITLAINAFRMLQSLITVFHNDSTKGIVFIMKLPFISEYLTTQFLYKKLRLENYNSMCVLVRIQNFILDSDRIRQSNSNQK
jgi:hypothetical protein